MKDPSIMHIDMNAFFASVEQRCNPALRGLPIAVIGSAGRTVVTTASYEARAFGVKTGMNKREARAACPGLIFVIGDNRKYIDASTRINAILKGFSPKVEAFSIDEAFVDLSGTAGLFGPGAVVAASIKERIREELGLTCSIGIAPNKLLAKLASDMQKPDGLVIIRQEDVAALLENLPASELCGIGPMLTRHLAGLGINTCGQLGRYPAGALRERFGMIGERLSLMGKGIDDSPVAFAHALDDAAKSVGHSTTLPADVSDKADIKRHLLKLSEMVGARSRRHGLAGAKVVLTVRYSDFYTFTRRKALPRPTNDTREIYGAACAIIDGLRLKAPVRLLGVSITDMAAGMAQLALFEGDMKRGRLMAALDSINMTFGSGRITWATLLEDEAADGFHKGVIAPSWRPSGVRMVDCK
ncbi:MAG: DNA polymerase IV [Deltaproteobacteria bacterium]|nr:DNA polymerase IV [Deltaproteobacteria bacterium]